jgi:hypothetical protein
MESVKAVELHRQASTTLSDITKSPITALETVRVDALLLAWQLRGLCRYPPIHHMHLALRAAREFIVVRDHQDRRALGIDRLQQIHDLQ